MENNSDAKSDFCKNMGIKLDEATDKDIYEPLLENQFREFVNGQQHLYSRQHNDIERWPVIRKSTCEFQTTSLNNNKNDRVEKTPNSVVFEYQSRIKGFFFMNALDPNDSDLRDDVFTKSFEKKW